MNLLVYFQLVLYIALVLTKVSLSNPNSGEYEEVTELDNGEVDSEELRERARSAHEDVHRKEESEKALEQVFTACTNACSITTAGVKLREALEKNREYRQGSGKPEFREVPGWGRPTLVFRGATPKGTKY